MELLGHDVRGLGNRTYVVVASGSALVVDPPRDTRDIEATVERAGARIAMVLETHRHADYVSGGLELSRRHQATYVVPPGGPEPAFAFTAAVGGARHEIADICVRVVATPGHTPHHVAYVVEDTRGPRAVFTGGSLLHRSVGRTDLHGAARTVELARAQWESAQRLADALPDDVVVLPTHGFGSLCSAAAVSATATMTIAEATRTNPALLTDRDAFVASLVAGYGPIPRHYARLPLVNAAGPTPFAAVPSAPRVDAADARALQREGHWLVDVRDRRSFAGGHLVGAVNIEVAGALAAYLPWLLTPGAGVILAGDDDGIAEAARQMRLVGLDSPVAIVDGTPPTWSAVGATLRSYPVRDAHALASTVRDGGGLVLDVRSGQERSGPLAPGTTHLPLPELADAWATGGLSGALKRRPVWVYCRSGFRAAVAASMLDAAGIPVTLVDATFDAILAACDPTAPAAIDLRGPRSTVTTIGPPR